MQSSFQSSRRLLTADVEQHLCGGQEEDGAAGEHGPVSDVFCDHRFSEAAAGDKNDVARRLEKVEREEGIDQGPVDGRGPVPVKVGHGFEFLQACEPGTTLQPATSAVLFLGVSKRSTGSCSHEHTGLGKRRRGR